MGKRGRRVAGEVVACAALIFVAALFWRLAAGSSGGLNELLVFASKVENGNPDSLVPQLDVILVIALLAFVVGSLTLVFLAQLFAKFFCMVLSWILKEEFAPVIVSDSLPPLRWFVVPVVAFIVSVACVKIYET